MTINKLDEVIKKFKLPFDGNKEQRKQAKDSLRKQVDEEIAGANVEQINALFSSLLKNNLNKEANRAFAVLVKGKDNIKTLAVLKNSLVLQKNKSSYSLLSNFIKSIIQKEDKELIIEVAKFLLEDKHSYFLYGLFDELVKQNKTYLIEPVTLGNYTERFVQLLVNYDNGKGVSLLWKLYNLDKLYNLPPSSIAATSFPTTTEYFETLLDSNKSHELFLSLADNNLNLINKTDEKGDTLLHVYTNMGHFSPYFGKLLAFSPHLDASIVDKKGNNVLHLGVRAHYATKGWWYHANFLDDLLENPNTHAALNQANTDGVTPLGLLFTHPSFFSADKGYGSHSTKLIALKLHEAGSKPFQAHTRNSLIFDPNNNPILVQNQEAAIDYLNDIIQILSDGELRLNSISSNIKGNTLNLLHDEMTQLHLNIVSRAENKDINQLFDQGYHKPYRVKKQQIKKIIAEAMPLLVLNADEKSFSNLLDEIGERIHQIIINPMTQDIIKEIASESFFKLISAEEKEAYYLTQDLQDKLASLIRRYGLTEYQAQIGKIIENLPTRIKDKQQSVDTFNDFAQEIASVIDKAEKECINRIKNGLKDQVHHIQTQKNEAKEWIKFKNVLELNKNDITTLIHLFVQKKLPGIWVSEYGVNGLLTFLKKAQQQELSFNELDSQGRTPFSILLSQGDLGEDATYLCAMALLEGGGNPLANGHNLLQTLDERIKAQEQFLQAKAPWETHADQWQAHRKALHKNSATGKKGWEAKQVELLEEFQQIKEDWSIFSQEAIRRSSLPIKASKSPLDFEQPQEQSTIASQNLKLFKLLMTDEPSHSTSKLLPLNENRRVQSNYGGDLSTLNKNIPKGIPSAEFEQRWMLEKDDKDEVTQVIKRKKIKIPAQELTEPLKESLIQHGFFQSPKGSNYKSIEDERYNLQEVINASC